MCAQFLVRTSVKAIKEKFGIKKLPQLEFDERIVPYRKAPVVIKNKKGEIEIHLMNFSLIPPWADEPKAKFSTHNARIDTILEKPLWKKPLAERRCLVPMTEFVEPIYTGKLAGNMVAFNDAGQEILTAAGIWSEWTNKKTGEVIESFTILTGDPYPFVKKTGHDRSPIFTDDEIYDEWLNPDKEDPAKMKELLLEHVQQGNFEARVDRPMAKGWEKRIPKDT